MKKRAERFKDQLGNNENLHLDEKKKNFRKRKLNRALGNKRILGNRNRLRFSNKRRNLRNGKFGGPRKIRNNAGNAVNAGNGNTRNRIGFKTRRGSIRRLRGTNRQFNN